MYYKNEITVNSYDVDLYNKLKLSSLLKYMEQVSEAHLISLGLPYEKLFRENLVFLLSKIYLKIDRMPGSQDKIVVKTAPVKSKGARFIREYCIDGLNGERLASALTLWGLVDPQNRRILKPSAFPYPLPLIDGNVEKIIERPAFPKIDKDLSVIPEKIKIKYADLDVNNHVNNSIYADYVCNVLPLEKFEKGADFLAISYNHEALFAEEIGVYTNRINEDEFYIRGLKTKENINSFEAIVNFKK